MKGCISWWIHNIRALLGSDGRRIWTDLEEMDQYSHVLEDYIFLWYLPHFVTRFLAPMQWVASIICSWHQNVLLYYRTRKHRAEGYGLKCLHMRAKMNNSSHWYLSRHIATRDFRELHSEHCLGSQWEVRASKQMVSGDKFTTWLHEVWKEHWLTKPARFLHTKGWAVRDLDKALKILINPILPPPYLG